MNTDNEHDLPELTDEERAIVEDACTDLIKRSVEITYPATHLGEEMTAEIAAHLAKALRDLCYRNARAAKARGEILTCEDNTGTDPFYSESNMEHLWRGAAALDAGQGQEHELIKDEKEKVTGN